MKLLAKVGSPNRAPCASRMDFSFYLPKSGDFLDPCPSPSDPPEYAPDEVPNYRCWPGKPGGALLRTPFWQGFCLLSGPTPWAPPGTN
eukprot:1149766-Pelagomonas_calceolata.AAC.4